jgi:hypothetical protein
MGRKKKLNIDLDNIDALEELMQEVYHDACSMIKDTQNNITNLMNSSQPLDTDELTKISKAKTDALKIKEAGIKLKLEVGKIQKEVINKRAEANANVDGAEDRISDPASISLDEFSNIRKLIEEDKKKGGE